MAESFFATLKDRVLLPPSLAHQNQRQARRQRVDRGPLQPPPATLRHRTDQPSRLRTAILNPDPGRATSRLAPCPQSGVRATPAAEGFVRGDDQAGAFVAGGDELEEQVRRFCFERDVADLVDDEQRVTAEPGELGLQGAGVVGVGEAGDPLGCGREQDAVAGLAGAGSRGRWRGGFSRFRAVRGAARCPWR